IHPKACSPRWLRPRAAGSTPGASKAIFWMFSKMRDSAVLNAVMLLKDLPPGLTRGYLWQCLAVDATHLIKVFLNLVEKLTGLLHQVASQIAVALAEGHTGATSSRHRCRIDAGQGKPARFIRGQVKLRCFMVAWVFLRQQVLEPLDRPRQLFNLG